MARKQKDTLGEATTSRTVRIVYTVAAVIALLGFADAIFLTVMHVTGQSAVCGGSAGCSQVLNSKYSQVGPVPVAVFGVLAYFSAFSFATLAAFDYARARSFFALTSAAMFLGTLWFLYAQAFLLHAFCPYCLFSAALTFLLMGLAIATPLPTRVEK